MIWNARNLQDSSQSDSMKQDYSRGALVRFQKQIMKS